jgi:tetratricopeptide (TPR) repeat protein
LTVDNLAVPFDRIVTLRNAVKLLRQGKLAPAIAEYVRVVEHDPTDWATANTLGDLYVRAGRVDKAVEQFLRVADGLNEQGDLQKAAALYKKVLKFKSDHEHAFLQAAEIASSQGLLAEARTSFATLIELRKTRGDARGAAQIRIRLGQLDQSDFESRLAAAGARVELGDSGGAVRDLKEIAAELREKGRADDAIAALREAARLLPTDDDVRARLLDVYVAAGDLAHARECATTVAEFKALAASLEARGASDEALETFRQAARLPDADAALKARVARGYAARGDLDSAAEFLSLESAGTDLQLLLSLAEIQLRGDHWDDGLMLLRRLLAEDPTRRDVIERISWALAAERPDTAFAVTELLADKAAARADWEVASDILQQFVARAPNHIPSLMRLIEVCVDGNLEAPMYAAQAQLTDAYLVAGSAAEARFLAEDLVAREPWEEGHIDRFRRALILLGETDPDKVIADRLSGDSPFTSTDRVLNSDELFPPLRLDSPVAEEAAEPAPPASAAIETAGPAVDVGATGAADGQLLLSETPPLSSEENESAAAAAAPQIQDESPAVAPQAAVYPVEVPEALAAAPESEAAFLEDQADPFALGVVSIDLDGLLDDVEIETESETETVEASAAEEDVVSDEELEEEDEQGVVIEEVDLSALLDEIDGVPAAVGLPAGDLLDLDGAEAFYRRGVALQESGDFEGCVNALEEAARAQNWKFAAAARLGRAYRERGKTPQAIEWFAKAAKAPARSPSESRELLYDYANALEASGDYTRALAVWLELQHEAGEYRDVAKHVHRLQQSL